MLNETLQKKIEPSLLLFCGIMGFIGCFAVLATHLVGIIVVDNHDPISDTISDLAAGRYNWIQDAGLQIFAIGLFACSVGMFTWNLGGIKWKISATLLILLAIDISIIAGHNEYGDGQPGGLEIHIYLVYFLGVVFALVTALAAFDLERYSKSWKHLSLGVTILWVVLSPLFFFVPDSITGAYERFIALIIVAWVAGISWLLIQQGQRKA